MYDVSIILENKPGTLAIMGECLGRAGISIEGGGVFVADGKGIAHFLFEDGYAAKKALEASGMKVLAVSEVIVQKLRQDRPGQLGKITRRMAEAGVNIEVMYSDHNNQLVLVVNNHKTGMLVSEKWKKEIAMQANDI